MWPGFSHASFGRTVIKGAQHLSDYMAKVVTPSPYRYAAVVVVAWALWRGLGARRDDVSNTASDGHAVPEINLDSRLPCRNGKTRSQSRGTHVT